MDTIDNHIKLMWTVIFTMVMLLVILITLIMIAKHKLLKQTVRIIIV